MATYSKLLKIIAGDDTSIGKLSADELGELAKQSKNNDTEIYNLNRKNEELSNKPMGEMMIIRNNNKIKKFEEENNNIKNYGVAEEEADQVVMHNISEDALQFNEKVFNSEMPAMSVAITGNKTTQGFDKFGDISLIGNKNLIDPKDTNNQVWNRDIYSTRTPSIRYETKLAYGAPKGIEDKVNNLINGGSVNPHEILQLDKSFNDSSLINEYKRDTGKKSINGESFKKWLINKEQQHKPTFKKDGKSYEATTDNVLKHIYGITGNSAGKTGRRQINTEDGFNASQAEIAERYKSIEAIKDNKSLLMTKDEMDKYVDDIGYKEKDLANDLGFTDYSGSKSFDNFRDMLYKGDVLGDEYGQKAQEMFINLQNEVKKSPSEYFEAILLRKVKLGEFKGALIPEGTSKETKQILKKNGIKIREYKEGERGETLNAFTKENKEWLLMAPLAFMAFSEETQASELPQEIKIDETFEPITENEIIKKVETDIPNDIEKQKEISKEYAKKLAEVKELELLDNELMETPETDRNWFEDIGKSTVLGILKGTRNTVDMVVVNRDTDIIGDKLLKGLDYGIRQFDEAQTITGEITGSLAQFIGPFGVAGGFRSKFFAEGMIKGAIVDMSVWDRIDPRLSNLLYEDLDFKNALFDYMRTKEDDTDLESRLKNMVEGVVLGGISDTLMLGIIKTYKTTKAALHKNYSQNEVDEIIKGHVEVMEEGTDTKQVEKVEQFTKQKEELEQFDEEQEQLLKELEEEFIVKETTEQLPVVREIEEEYNEGVLQVINSKEMEVRPDLKQIEEDIIDVEVVEKTKQVELKQVEELKQIELKKIEEEELETLDAELLGLPKPKEKVEVKTKPTLKGQLTDLKNDKKAVEKMLDDPDYVNMQEGIQRKLNKIEKEIEDMEIKVKIKKSDKKFEEYTEAEQLEMKINNRLEKYFNMEANPEGFAKTKLPKFEDLGRECNITGGN
jgi:hypothetical protein